MPITNATSRSVFVSLFYIRDPSYAYNLPVPIAASSVLLAPGQTNPLNHPRDPEFRIGIAEQGRTIPAIAGDLLFWSQARYHQINYLLIVERGGRIEVVHRVPPVADPEPRRTTPDQMNTVAIRELGYDGTLFGAGRRVFPIRPDTAT